MIVFAGPSLPLDARPDDPAIDWRPPAQAGDFLTLLDNPPERVLLIDGFFDTRPAVTHKECLALMAAGTTLIGAASMGALRHAELADFGMMGSGEIARQYARAELIGDDEVAVAHGDARIGWKPISVAMVDVRATVLACAGHGHIGIGLASALLQSWHDIHYADRDWPLMIKSAEHLADKATLQRIADSHVQAKQRDALEALAEAPGMTAKTHSAVPPQTRWLRQLGQHISQRPARP